MLNKKILIEKYAVIIDKIIKISFYLLGLIFSIVENFKLLKILMIISILDSFSELIDVIFMEDK